MTRSPYPHIPLALLLNGNNRHILTNMALLLELLANQWWDGIWSSAPGCSGPHGPLYMHFGGILARTNRWWNGLWYSAMQRTLMVTMHYFFGGVFFSRTLLVTLYFGGWGVCFLAFRGRGYGRRYPHICTLPSRPFALVNQNP
jgi:hypothetical protein